MDELTTYFSKHHARLNYARRRHAGRSIGSGMVEGAAKDLIGRRLKQAAARWSVENVPRIAQVCCLTYSDSWAAYRGEAA